MADLPTQLFEHTPLPTKSSIRLVSLVQDDPNVLPPMIYGVPLIRLSLATVDLENEPLFDALSYTWGSPFPDNSEWTQAYKGANSMRPIALNGCIHYIGRDLWEFLQQAKQTIARRRPMVDKYVDKRLKPYNKTRLIIAAENGILAQVHNFLRLGADIKAQDKFGEMALHYAAENGHMEVVKLLVNYGSDINIRDNTGRTPLDCAIQREKGAFKDVIHFLRNVDTLCEPVDLQTDIPLTAARPIWIDSICINQSDIPERNAQVAIMSKIYSHAASVIVWLGIEDEYAAPAFEGMINNENQNGTRTRPVFEDWLMYVRWSSAGINNPHEILRNNLTSKGMDQNALETRVKQVIAITHLLSRAWWSRIWIIQELALARRILMTCGTLEVAFHDTFIPRLPAVKLPSKLRHRSEIPTMLSTFELAKRSGTSGLEAFLLADIRLRTSECTHEREVISSNPPKTFEKCTPPERDALSIQALGIVARWFHASDPRDKIFALLGLALSDGSEKMKADYSMSTVMAYIRYGSLFVRGYEKVKEGPNESPTGVPFILECLEGLSYVQHSAKSSSCVEEYKSQLPSWTSNFSVSTVTNRIWSQRFNACKSVSGAPTVLIGADPRVIHVNGAKFDKVVGIESYRKIHGDFHLGLPLAWLELLTTLHPIYPAGRSRTEALWQTLTAGSIPHTTDSGRIAFRNFMRRNLWYALDDPSLGPMLDQLRETDAWDALPSMQEIEAPPQKIRDRKNIYIDLDEMFSIAWRRYYTARCLFRTERGYLGLGPETIEPGDEVWLVAGSRTPFILRKLDESKSKKNARRLVNSIRNSFRKQPSGSQDSVRRNFVGESYVHGIMNGEAEELLDFCTVSLE
ncbi:hypothetical protein BDV25DRAFT_137923 [Aspergillus avenaceus]|uniref:Heterokaryon incompatibility domain-containing protein n=1 Tax=Aspergillus avenaceus TaxID=36643 RepID=A0A5N6U1B0_ASPAV|nr:hypothetical protein BDV25DRAFT_137923 [Aspergillus avenaceus]